jgi:hypothetical protein
MSTFATNTTTDTTRTHYQDAHHITEGFGVAVDYDAYAQLLQAQQYHAQQYHAQQQQAQQQKAQQYHAQQQQAQQYHAQQQQAQQYHAQQYHAQQREIENRYFNRSPRDDRLFREQQQAQYNERNLYRINSDEVACWNEQGQPMNTEWDDCDPDPNADHAFIGNYPNANDADSWRY